MVVGHCAAGILGKSAARDVPLWWFLLAANLIDLVSLALGCFHLEDWQVRPEWHQDQSWAWALDLSKTTLSHHFLGALLISLAFAAACRALQPTIRPRALLILFLVAWSHWWLDLIVHRPDLPMVMDLPPQGWSLWRHAHASFLLEAALLLAASLSYFGRTHWLPEARALMGGAPPANWQAWLLPALLLVLLAMVTYLEPLSLPWFSRDGGPYYLVQQTFLICFLGIAWLGHLIDRRRGPLLQGTRQR